MDLFIETPKQVAERQLREQQQQIDALNRATSAFNASQKAYLNTIKNMNTQGIVRTSDVVLDPFVNSDDTATIGALSPEDIAAIQRAAQIAAAQSKQSPIDETKRDQQPQPSAYKERKQGWLSRITQAQSDRKSDIHDAEYKRERAFDKHRRLLHILGLIGRVLAIVILTPLMVIAIFTAAYLMTCILNGATPAELPGLLSVMWDSGISFVMELMALV